MLIYQGLRGAAWTAICASYILGFRACALDRDRNFEDARVILDLTDPLDKFDFYLKGNLQELTVFDVGQKGVQTG